MKRFRYRLQALLKMKEHIEKERQKELAASSQQVRSKEEELDLVQKNRDRTFEFQRNEILQSFTVAEMLVISRYLHKLKRETVVGKELLRVLKVEEEKRRRKLLDASRERKKYEKLKEKQQQKHYDNARSAITKEMDETAVSTYRQKAKGRRSTVGP
ncbi:MAG: flagellar export protein FliJ [Candidatus Zixiibacteriota bacterium]|nr:MAG: flagellar export protein FliJ [candidate division Zixibacteria bacterium]